jgi:hypothetical protein
VCQRGTGACLQSATPSFSFNAQSGPAGQNPSGTFFFSDLGSEFTVTVTCLKVSGHTATLLGTVTVGTGVYDPTVPENGYGGDPQGGRCRGRSSWGHAVL